MDGSSVGKDLAANSMHERQQRNILQTGKVLDLVMQSVGPYNVISSLDEMREVRHAFENGCCSCRETHEKCVHCMADCRGNLPTEQ